MNFPRDLVDAVRSRQVVPFVGAGLSMGVKPGLFPSWPRLLEGLADGMVEYGLPEDVVAEVRQRIARGEFLAAAEQALQELGHYRFNSRLRERLRHHRPADVDLTTVRALWALRPPVVLTTNYDDVLLWGRERAEAVSNDQLDELNLMDAMKGEDEPRIWHLHGTIHRIATLVLAGADYQRLYGDDSKPAGYSSYTHALMRLRTWIGSRPFLYVGFSFNDAYVLKQLEHVIGITQGRHVPSFALMKKGQIPRGALWPRYNIQLLEYEDHGAPLTDYLNGLAREAFGPGGPGAPVGTGPSAASPPAPVPRSRLEQEYAHILSTQSRLVLLAPEEGGARSLARGVAARYGERSTWLAPPNVPDCSEAEYCQAIANENSVTSFDALVDHLRARAERLGREHLIVLRYEWGPLAHLEALGSTLRRMLDEPSATRFHFLISGGERSAWLLHHVARFSVFAGSPRREVPDFTVDEVSALLDSVGQEGARWCAEVHAATGGHLGLLREALGSPGPLTTAAVTERLSRGPALRAILRERLRQDERNRYRDARSCRAVLEKLLAGQPVEALAKLDHRTECPEVRLYFSGLVHADASGATRLRCEAVARVAREELATKDVLP